MDAPTPDHHWWLDEIDLDPDHSPLRMATHALGDQSWLLVDENRDAELALKADLFEARPGDVFAAGPECVTPSEEVERLVLGGDHELPSERVNHPLARAGLGVQEDLCLVRRRDDAWYLEAASLSFPSRWSLTDKIGRPLHEVHGPVKGYAEHLAERVTSLLDRLGDRIVRRRNWFVHPDSDLFQPHRPIGGEPVVAAADALDGLFVRSERQTLRRLEADLWTLFTIRVQQCPLGALAQRRGDALGRYLADAAPATLSHRGLSPTQVAELELVEMGSSLGFWQLPGLAPNQPRLPETKT